MLMIGVKGSRDVTVKKKKKRLISGLLEIVIFIVTSDNQKIFDINGFLGLFN